MTSLGLDRLAPAPVERRSAGDYTAQVVAGLVAAATGSTAAATATAAAEQAAGIVGRALAAASVSGDGGTLSPRLLDELGRDLILRGEAVYLFDVDAGGRGRLLRATDATVEGDSPDPADWRYRLTLHGPTGSRVRTASAEAVAHFRWSTRPETPWRGVGPLERATLASRIAARLSESLSAEASVAVARLLPVPAGTGEATRGALAAALQSPSGGRLALPETTAAGFGAGRSASPLRDWRAERLTPDPAAAAVELHRLIETEIGGACGVPAPLMAGAAAAGPAMREAWRGLLVGTIQPLGRLISTELGRVVEASVSLTFEALAAGDSAGRARAIHVLTQAGEDLATARRLVGWET